MDTKHLVSVEKWTLAFAAAIVAFAMLVLSRKTAFGVTVGAAVMVLNAWALRKIGNRSFKTFKKPSSVVLLFNLKMGLLIALIYVVLRFLPVDPIGFVIGISILPAAIVAVAIRHSLKSEHDSEETHG